MKQDTITSRMIEARLIRVAIRQTGKEDGKRVSRRRVLTAAWRWDAWAAGEHPADCRPEGRSAVMIDAIRSFDVFHIGCLMFLC